MEKNQTSCPKAVCEKIFRAITFGPAFSTIRRISRRQQTPSPAKHARNHPSLPNSSDPPIKPLDIKTKLISPQRPKPSSKEASEIPIQFDYITDGSTQNINGQAPLASMAQQAKTPKPSTSDMVRSGKPTVLGNGQQVSGVASKHEAEKSNGQIQVKNEEGKKPTQQYDDTFSAYINQTRKRIISHDQDYGENSPKVVGHNHGHGVAGKDHHFSDYIDQTKRKIRTTSSIKDRSESFFK